MMGVSGDFLAGGEGAQSGCLDRFGYPDFDVGDKIRWPATACPVKGCNAPLQSMSSGKHEFPYCRLHGIRLHSGTFD